ncbi:MAG TPA: hypothetical protein VJZ27_07745, partial [Aggregatilineales bacterium]|nr:hypothetical protein [Aggregatilineales bacterium]
ITIENYFIDPSELENLLPPAQKSAEKIADLRRNIENHVNDWLKHGALSQVLHIAGAHDFCRGLEGYPRGLLGSPPGSETEISEKLSTYRDQLAPEPVLEKYRVRLDEFRNHEKQYISCINGKMFFREVVVTHGLNKIFGQKSSENWIKELFSITPEKCPDDLILVLQRLFPGKV